MQENTSLFQIPRLLRYTTELFLLSLFNFNLLIAQDTEANKIELADQVTFISHRSGKNLLYRMSIDGSDVKPIFGGALKDIPVLNSDVLLYREPHWSRQSPNGEYFLSWAYDKGLPYSKYQGLVSPLVTHRIKCGLPVRPSGLSPVGISAVRNPARWALITISLANSARNLIINPEKRSPCPQLNGFVAAWGQQLDSAQHDLLTSATAC